MPVNPVPEGVDRLITALTMSDARRAIDLYKKVFDAEELSCMAAPNGTIMHAELRINQHFLMVHDEVMGQRSPRSLGGASASLWLYVEDCDQLFHRAVSAGFEVVMPMADKFWGDRFGSVRDPEGYTWAIASHIEDVPPEELARRGREAIARRLAEG